MDLVVVLELSLFVILLGFSGFFSSSETALFSLNKRELDQMRRDDNPRIELIERLLSQPRRLIVTILIGNEFVNVAASVISAAIIIRVLGADSKLINLLIMVPILLLVGEITPKTLAIRNNAAFASFQARPIEFFAKLITPPARGHPLDRGLLHHADRRQGAGRGQHRDPGHGAHAGSRGGG